MIKREDSFFASMPNLALCGLSENWLLKECGNQHWLALAEQFGLQLPEFKTLEDIPVYAAFTSVNLQKLELHLIDENSSFTIETRLAPVGRARFYSLHKLYSNGKDCGTIEMLSAQITRQEQGNNQSVVRVELPKSKATCLEDTTQIQAFAQQLTDNAKSIRSGTWERWHDLHNFKVNTLPNYLYSPCPNNDFNGADFFYFANFQAAADRAEWNWNNNRELWQVLDRQINYYGNINIGDALHFKFSALQITEGILEHWFEVYRNSDDSKIADVMTRKSRIRKTNYRWAVRNLA